MLYTVISRVWHFTRYTNEQKYGNAYERIRVTIRLGFTTIFPRDFFLERTSQKTTFPLCAGWISKPVAVRPVFRLICQNQFEARGRKAGFYGARERYSICSFSQRNTRKRGCIFGRAYSVTP